MSTIKKAYVAIVELLQANEDEAVSSILPQVIAIASAKAGGGGGATTSHKDEAGNVIAVRCFYFGKWMDPAEVEFGKKASSSTGLNSMCKEGVSLWTKQQRAAKAAKEQLLTDVAAGIVESSDLTTLLQDIEDERNLVAEFEGVAYDTLEELLAA